MKMETLPNTNLCILPLQIIDEFSYQKCILPQKIFESCGIHAGTWMKCKVKGDANGYTICQIYGRDIDQHCCYMDNIVGNICDIGHNYLYGLERIERSKPKLVQDIEVTIEMSEQFFNTRLRQLLPSQLAITVKQFLAALHFTVGCAVRTDDAKRLGISAIYINACRYSNETEVTEHKQDEKNDLCFMDSNTKITIRNFHISTADAAVDDDTFIMHGFEQAWHDLEALLTVAKLRQKCKQSTISGLRPHFNVLLVGPAGCGKTTMLKAFVTRHKLNCFHITNENVMQQYPGEAEAELRKVFDNALHLHAQLKAEDPTVIIIENLELICPTVKSSTTDAVHSNRICTQLVDLLDNFHNSSAGVFCIATTSDSMSINPTACRPGRFQDEVCIDWPKEDVRKMLFKAMFEKSKKNLHLNQLELDAELLDLVGKRTQGYVAADLELLVQNIERKLLREKEAPDISDLVKSALHEIKPASVHATDVTVYKVIEGFECIGGMDDLKRTLEVSVLAGLRQQEAYKRFGLRLPKGMLLYGPPGCAKTTIAKCLAKEANMTFISTSGAEVYSPYVGCAEKFISKIFDTARKNAPCLIFFDEIDSLVGRRAIGATSSNDVNLRILSTLLTEMDGIIANICNGSNQQQQQILVVAASNRPDMIDAALLRPGRLSKHIFVPPPDLQSRIAILQLHAKRMPFAVDVNFLQIAEATDFYTGADMCNLCNEAALVAFQRIEDFKAECEIVASDFVAALESTKSSLSKAQMSVYLRFQQKIEHKSGS